MGLISRVSSRTYREVYDVTMAFRLSALRAVALGTRPINNKPTTNIYGLPVEPYALDKYPNVLERTIDVLKKYPAESDYAKMMIRFSEDQLQKVNSARNVDDYEANEGRQIEAALFASPKRAPAGSRYATVPN